MGKEVTGLLLVNKPEGVSSAFALNRVKRIFSAGKAGHAGTLDPFATGLLVCLFGKATRLSRFFLHSGKGYKGVIRLGWETDTLDKTGKCTKEDTKGIWESLNEENVCRALEKFTGTIRQMPPMYSALKHNGRPLYQLARSGETVKREMRTITINNFVLTGFALPEIRFSLECSGGTYVRSLARDLGRELGTCAHLLSLERTKVGDFDVQDAHDIETIEETAKTGRQEDILIPMEDAVSFMPKVSVDEQTLMHIQNGRLLYFGDFPAFCEDVSYFGVLSGKGKLFAILQPEKKEKRYHYCCVFS